jgi:hypothetical protein
LDERSLPRDTRTGEVRFERLERAAFLLPLRAVMREANLAQQRLAQQFRIADVTREREQLRDALPLGVAVSEPARGFFDDFDRAEARQIVAGQLMTTLGERSGFLGAVQRERMTRGEAIIFRGLLGFAATIEV